MKRVKQNPTFFQPSPSATEKSKAQELVDQIYADPLARLNTERALKALEQPGDCLFRLGKHNRKATLQRRNVREKASLLQSRTFKIDYMDDQRKVHHLEAKIENGQIIAGSYTASSVADFRQQIQNTCNPSKTATQAVPTTQSPSISKKP